MPPAMPQLRAAGLWLRATVFRSRRKEFPCCSAGFARTFSSKPAFEGELQGRTPGPFHAVPFFKSGLPNGFCLAYDALVYYRIGEDRGP